MNISKLRQAILLGVLFAAGLIHLSALAEQFTIAVIPGTSGYCDSTNQQYSYLPIFIDETSFIANQKSARNIVFVTHLGDVVRDGNLFSSQWQYARDAMDVLSASGIPFSLTPGEHDYDNFNNPTNSRPVAGVNSWVSYFGASTFASKSWYGGSFNGGLDSWQTFSAGGKTFLHISLELEASDVAIAWAFGVITNHPGLPTILTTHEYLSYRNDDTGKALRLDEGYRNGVVSYNNAQALWDKLIYPNDQVFLVLCGHGSSATDENGVSDGENLRIDNNAAGHPVYQVLSDYQSNTFGADGTPGAFAGGAGWLRFMTFDTQSRTIHFQTYSVELNQYAGVSNGPSFNLPARMSDFTLAVPERVFGPWKFGVMDDTQWTLDSDAAGANPSGVPVSIISQINAQFIKEDVKFVFDVGDLVNYGDDASESIRAQAAKPLIDAGIGFFPMRGGHDTFAALNNGYSIPIFRTNYPQTRGVTNTFGATRFNSPTNVSEDLDGMSYAFDFGIPGSSARFVVLDNWVTPSKSVAATNNNQPYGYSFGDQQSWISSQLNAKTRSATHAFVFSHQPLMAEFHQDSPFVGSTYDNLEMQNAFYASLMTNGVRYYICGHDHLYQRSRVASPDGNSFVEEIIGASDSTKFYSPGDTNDAGWHGQKYRETSLSQDLRTIGYYIYTVDGPRVNVDYYADDHGNWGSDSSYPVALTQGGYSNGVTPNFRFVKKETFGYSLNGQSFYIAQGEPYAVVNDSIAAGNGYLGTAAKLLGGANASTTRDGSSRPLTKQVSTGWSVNLSGLASDILTLWGLQELGASNADTCALSLSYDPSLVSADILAGGSFALASRDSNGLWFNAVASNTGGAPQFVSGPWKSSYGLGTFGSDTNSHTVWAVVNHQGDFAAAPVALVQAAVLSGPVSGAVFTNGYPILQWSGVPGATTYIVALTGSGGQTTYYTSAVPSLALSFPLTNGDYTWSVTGCNIYGSGLSSSPGAFTLQRSGSTTAWSFGLIADTQWDLEADDGQSPNSIPAGIIRQIDQAFIDKGVKLVISVGDTVNNANKTDLDTRAVLAQELYNAGIGFYMVRGNHEAGWAGSDGSGPEITRIFPQNLNGINNVTPSDCTTNLISGDDLANLNLPPKTGGPFIVGFNFTSPDIVFNGVAKTGLTYAFDYNNARFVLLDMFDDSGDSTTSVISHQQPWITSVLADPNRPEHAFVFSHKNLLGGRHKDNLFGPVLTGDDPGDGDGVDTSFMTDYNLAFFKSKRQSEEAFISCLATNNVRYYFSGHDHHYYYSMVRSPLSANVVRQFILGSDSSKFFVPLIPVSPNDTPFAQQVNAIGYSIVTVEGDNVTVDYYSVDVSANASFTADFVTGGTISTTPKLTGNWVKSASFGYGLNGQEFIVPQGSSYTIVADTTAKAVSAGAWGYAGTAANILSGSNSSTLTTASVNDSRPLSRNVATGWAPAAAGCSSDILRLWGLADLGADRSDTFVLSMTYAGSNLNPASLQSGLFCLGTRDAGGKWINAVDANRGGIRRFISGPWKSSYGLGSFGVNIFDHTVWAVINHAGDFAAIQLQPSLSISRPDSRGNMALNFSALDLTNYQLQFNADLTTTNWVPIATTNWVPGTSNGFFRYIRAP